MKAVMALPIKRTIDRIPGGMMIVPLFTGTIINAVAPETPRFFGSFTGAALMIPFFAFALGAGIKPIVTAWWARRAGRAAQP